MASGFGILNIEQSVKMMETVLRQSEGSIKQGLRLRLEKIRSSVKGFRQYVVRERVVSDYPRSLIPFMTCIRTLPCSTVPCVQWFSVMRIINVKLKAKHSISSFSAALFSNSIDGQFFQWNNRPQVQLHTNSMQFALYIISTYFYITISLNQPGKNRTVCKINLRVLFFSRYKSKETMCNFQRWVCVNDLFQYLQIINIRQIIKLILYF